MFIKQSPMKSTPVIVFSHDPRFFATNSQHTNDIHTCSLMLHDLHKHTNSHILQYNIILSTSFVIHHHFSHFPHHHHSISSTTYMCNTTKSTHTLQSCYNSNHNFQIHCSNTHQFINTQPSTTKTIKLSNQSCHVNVPGILLHSHFQPHQKNISPSHTFHKTQTHTKTTHFTNTPTTHTSQLMP